MSVRVVFGQFLVRLGRFIQSLALMVMKPDDLVEFSKRTYAASKSVEGWGSDDLIDSGLDQEETALLAKIPVRNCRLLLLGAGGGREAISFAQMGFEMTVLDFVPEMVQKAQENARKRGLHLQGVVQEISKLDMPAASFDIIWLSSRMYSCVPTVKRRMKMLRRIYKTLRPGGYFICQFHWMAENLFTPKVEFIRKLFSFLSFGNFPYEKGDMLWNNVEFIHAFSSEEGIRSEFKAGDFEISHIFFNEANGKGGAILIKEIMDIS